MENQNVKKNIKLILPSAWVPDLDMMAHVMGISRLEYIRSKLRTGMDEDLEKYDFELRASKKFRQKYENPELNRFRKWSVW